MNLDLDVLRSFAKKVAGTEKTADKKVVVKLAGVTFDNRQPIIKVMKEDTNIKLERDRANPHDFYAVGVLANIADMWIKIGFIPKTDNRNIAESLDSGIKLVARIVGFNEVVDEPTRGVTVCITEE